MMSKTVRKQVTVYVLPELKAEIEAILKSSDHNRETESSVGERLFKEALDARRARPNRMKPTRLQRVGA